MEPLVFVLAILGCNDAGSRCEPARTMPATYVSEAACLAAQESALLAATDVDYPVVQARCRASAPVHLAANAAADSARAER